MNKYTFCVFAVLIALKPLMSFGNQCHSIFTATTSTDRRTVMGTQLPLIADTLAQAFQKKNIAPEKTFFIILPGNMGKTWQHTNHNLGYDLLLPLIKNYQAVGTTQKKQDFQTPLETLTFHPKDLGEEADAADTQAFYSEKGTYRSTTGEAFVSFGQRPDAPTFVFLRRNGYYNDGGNFFVPFIKHAGGRTENIIVIHDDLKLDSGKIEVSVQKSNYDGNRAILSLHNNLNALNLSTKIHQNRNKILEILLGSFSARLAEFNISSDKLIEQIEAATWKTAVEMKNQGDAVSFRSAFSNSLKGPYVELLKKLRTKTEAAVPSELLRSLEQARAEIKTAADKKLAAEKFKESVAKAAEDFPSYKDYLNAGELLANADSKKGEAVQKVYAMVADNFDPRIMDNSFSSIRLGTGYEAWKIKNQQQKFPLPVGYEDAESGSYTHFVLSPRDQNTFDTSFEQRVIEALDRLVQEKLGR